ncbi:hypothetical protein LCGC14_0294700 [marine sediment metagenome]|uniref:Uncharacterized protein n=1 Tax=marine sediment metagenome TaxID=412755 RepID=A0A0F9U929_9ZZZZ
MAEVKYEGWTNYETWAVKLWMDNEEPSYNYWKERTEEIAKDAKGDQYTTSERMAVHNLATALKDEHEEAVPDLEGFAGDLLMTALGSVNWYEIAKSLLEDYEP